MPAIFETVKVSTGASPALRTYYFRTKAGLYDGTIASVTGVSKASESEEDEPTVSIGVLLQKGILLRVKGRQTVNGKKRTVNLVCAREKAGTILDGLEGTPYNGREIESASFPVRRTFY